MVKPYSRWRMNPLFFRTMNINAITMKNPIYFITLVISGYCRGIACHSLQQAWRGGQT